MSASFLKIANGCIIMAMTTTIVSSTRKDASRECPGRKIKPECSGFIYMKKVKFIHVVYLLCICCLSLGLFGSCKYDDSAGLDAVVIPSFGIGFAFACRCKTFACFISTSLTDIFHFAGRLVFAIQIGILYPSIHS